MEDNPATYVEAQVFADERGRILARVSNRSGVVLNNVRVDFAVVIEGEIRRQSRMLASLQGGTYTDLASGITFPEGSTWTADMMSAEVVAAQP